MKYPFIIPSELLNLNVNRSKKVVTIKSCQSKRSVQQHETLGFSDMDVMHIQADKLTDIFNTDLVWENTKMCGFCVSFEIALDHYLQYCR